MVEGQKKINVALMGLGVVGTGVARALTGMPSSGVFNLKRVLVRDSARARDIHLAEGVITTEADDILLDPGIGIVVEVMGGEDPATGYLRRALESGKHVVTANKEVMAKSGASLLETARKNTVNLLFEASVGGGIPIVGCLMNELAGNEVRSIRSIINGTTNYILTRMANERAPFRDALAEAQALGYAEADPTNDVEGIDASYKLTVLATLAYRSRFQPEDVFRQGISGLEPQDFRYAQEFGYAIKSLAVADWDGKGVQLRVYPALVHESDMLAKVDGVYNAVEVEGSLSGKVLFHGMGAGQGPTTSAVMGDIIETARLIRNGSMPVAARQSDGRPDFKPIDDLVTRYYIRLNVSDQPGVLAQIARVLGDGQISIASVLQKDSDAETQSAEIVIMTHPAREASVQQALDSIDKLPSVRRVSNMIRIAE